jgi:hypothetical protein
MATIISSKTSGVGGLTVTGDASGVLQLASADGTTAVTIDASQNVTFAKGLTVGATAAPAFSAYQSTLQSIPAGPPPYVKILFQTEEFDTNSNYDTTTSRFTPTVAGYYQVSGGFQILSASTSGVIVVYKNGAAYKFGTYPSVAGVNPLLAVSCLVYCNGSTDYVEIWGSAALISNTNPTASNTYFQAAMIRSA